ncbi:MAG: CPBP family glutamic-type intramembrane protease [Methylosarcina sp.]
MIRSIMVALVPLAVLLAASSVACIAGYIIMLGLGDTFPFRKVISKTTQLLLVLSVFPAMAWLRLNKEDLGFVAKKLFIKQLAQGFALGLVTLLPVFVIEYALGIHIFDQTKDWTFALVAQKISISLVLALLISLIEEPIFRGILLTGLTRKLPVLSAVVISSTYYAALHFLNSHTEIPFQELNVFSGFDLLKEAFANLLNPGIYSAFFALLMVGIFLCLLRTHFNASLALCIGCHTAWVWQIKMFKSLFNIHFKTKYLYLVSSYDGVIGPLVTLWLMLAVSGYFVYRYYYRGHGACIRR